MIPFAVWLVGVLFHAWMLWRTPDLGSVPSWRFVVWVLLWPVIFAFMAFQGYRQELE